MVDNITSILMQEYEHLCASYDKNATIGYTVVPGVLAITAGIALVNLSAWKFIAIGFPLIVFLVFTVLGICHSVSNFIGLRLVEVECKINKHLNCNPSEGLSFYSKVIAQGTQVIPGLKWYHIFLALFTISSLLYSILNAWKILTGYHLPLWQDGLIIGVPLILNIFVIINMSISEIKVQQAKKDIISEYKIGSSVL